MKGSTHIAAPRARVWAFLTDAQSVSQCAPGLESLEVRDPGKRFRAVTAVGLGSMRVRFTLDVEWEELHELDWARMRVHGTASGSTADVSSRIDLRDSDQGGTDLDWTADVSIHGPLASLASRLMGSVAKKASDDFFACVSRRVQA